MGSTPISDTNNTENYMKRHNLSKLKNRFSDVRMVLSLSAKCKELETYKAQHKLAELLKEDARNHYIGESIKRFNTIIRTAKTPKEYMEKMQQQINERNK